MAAHAERNLIAARDPRLARPPWQFWALHVVAVTLLLPVVGMTRLLPTHWREHRDESIFAETHRTVLTALGTAFML